METTNRNRYRRQLRKEKWNRIFDYFGGRKCSHCGIESKYPIYDLHHIDPTEKDFKISKGIYLKWESILEEIKKCELLCSNCHRIEHYRIKKEQLNEQKIK